MKILFTGGGGAGAEAIYRLMNGVHDMHFADAVKSSINPIIPEQRRHQIYFASNPLFAPHLTDLCKSLAVDILVPGVDEELLVLARNINNFKPVRLLLPREDYIKIMLDKMLTSSELSYHSLPTPITSLFSDDFSHLVYPCIVKPRNGRGSRGLTTVNSLSEALALKQFYSLSVGADKFVIQEKAIGQEYTVQMICSGLGQLKYVVPVKVGVKRGITLSAAIDANEKVTRTCELIHSKLPTTGTYNIQLILTDSHQVLPFEINPRVSTTLCLAIAAGVDPFMQFIDNDDLLIPSTSVSCPLSLTRHWTNLFT